MLTRRHFLAAAASGALLPRPLSAQARWTTAAPLPTPRGEIAAAQVGGRIYVLADYSFRPELEIYDPTTDRWTRGAPLPRPLHHTAAVGFPEAISSGAFGQSTSAPGGKLYVFGGYTDHHWTVTAETLEYDPKTDRWTKRAPMPTPRGALAAARLGSLIHCVSGIGPGSPRRNTGVHEAYDPMADRWTTRTPLPQPRDHHAVVGLEGRLYVIGGRIDGSYARNIGTHDAWDANSDRWETRPALPTARSGIAAAVLDRQIVVVGGEAPSGTFAEVEAFNPRTNTWTAYPGLPTPRHGLAAVTVGNRLYVLGGGPTPGGSSSTTNEVLSVTP